MELEKDSSKERTKRERGDTVGKRGQREKERKRGQEIEVK